MNTHRVYIQTVSALIFSTFIFVFILFLFYVSFGLLQINDTKLLFRQHPHLQSPIFFFLH